MKRILYISAIAFLAACSGTVDPENTGNPEQEIPEEFTEPFTLSADKTEVEASGKDFVTFSLKDAYGREMLQDKNTLQSINIVSEEGVRVPRMETKASFIANGTYNFTAKFKGKPSANTVQVNAVNRAKYEVFHKNVGLFKCTSVWCSACPYLAENLHKMSDEAKEHSVVLAIHGDFSGQEDPFSLYVDGTDLGSYMMGWFGGQGWPTLIYDLSSAKTGSSNTTEIENEIMDCRIEHPATCGIKVTSVAVEGTALKVSATMKSSTGGEYDMACAVLRNGLAYAGGYSLDNSGIYDEVVVNLSESFIGYYKGDTVEKDAELSETFTFEFGGSVPSAEVLEDYYVAVYVHRKTSEGSVLDNIVICGYDKTVDYQLND